MSSLLLLLFLPVVLFVVLHTTSNVVNAAELGGEQALYRTRQMRPNTMHRQNVCHRYDLFRNETVELKDALEGLQLRVGMAAYPEAYFNYDPKTGIDPEYPGLAAVILDELATRGKFTWRDSFGLTGDPSTSNTTWHELLLWSTEAYDVHIDWWSQELDRMNAGVAFLTEWYDSSIILISTEAPEEVSNEINFWNWLKPYDSRVWMLTIFTIFISGIVYQILEHFADDRQDRSMWEWWQENFYMSAINATQAYEYQPKSLASRIFGISMASWALVMTATYTANLASLLVDRKPPSVVAQSVDEVAVFGNKICTWEGTHSDNFIRTQHPGATRIPKKTILEVYEGLRDGECEFAAEAVASWNKLKAMKEYNPQCNLYWVGGDRRALDVGAGFVTKADSGRMCTGFIRDVLNYHMREMIEDGFLAQAWEKEFERTQNIDCDNFRPEVAAALKDNHQVDENDDTSVADKGLDAPTRRKLLITKAGEESCNQQRRLRRAAASAAAGGAIAAAAADDEGEAMELKLEQMVGTFMFHYALMLISLGIAGWNYAFDKHAKPHAVEVTGKVLEKTESLRRSFVTRTGSFVNRSSRGGSDLMGDRTQRTLDMSARRVDEDMLYGKRSVLDLGISTRTDELSCRDDTTEEFASDAQFSEKTQKEMQKEMTQLRKYQLQMRCSQESMERAQTEMLAQQRQLQAQLQALLSAQSPVDPLNGQPAPPVADQVGEVYTRPDGTKVRRVVKRVVKKTTSEQSISA